MLDTHDLLLATFRYTARTVLREAIPDERLMAKVGQPLNTQMWDFTDDPAVHEELCRVYREYNAEVHDDMIRLFEGTVPMLERLKEAGLPLAVVTSKRHEVAMRGLDLFGLTGYFDFLIGSDDWPEHKPHPGPVAHGCERLGLAPVSYTHLDVYKRQIHSMVEYSDGSVKAHLGTTDMRIPIQFALSYPERWDAPVEPLDFTKLGTLEFAAPDTDTFRCLALARAAGERGGTLPCVMNAANEVAVAAFLAEEGSYLGIAACVEAVMDAHERQGVQRVESLDQLEELDAWARAEARRNVR